MLGDPHRNFVLAFRIGFVWLRLAVERKPEADPAGLTFKSSVFTIEQILHFVRAKKSLQLIEVRGGDQNDDRRGKSFFAYLLCMVR